MKPKFKQMYVIVLMLIFVICTLSACGTQNSQDIVGKWYNNSSGKSLDIRSDNTYKLENDYGTGTWKYLDDGETIEFKDFYGSTIESRVSKDEKGEYIDFANSGIFYNGKDIEKKEFETKGISVTKTEISPFFENRALIEYEDKSGKKYAAMIDSEGHILYKLENGNIEWDYYNINKGGGGCMGFSGVAYFNSYYSDTPCNIIDKNGNVIATSDDMGFDYALACGQGMVLVYKDNSNIDGNQYCYGIIDSSGKWQIQLTNVGYECSLLSDVRYAGNGIFAVRATKESDFSKEHVTILFNGYTGNYYIMSGDCFHLEFIDNNAYYAENNDCIRINTDFEKEKVGSCDYVKGGYSILNGEYLTITNCSTGKSVKFTEFKSDQIESISFKNDCGLIKLEGKDGNPYFTIINGDGVMQFKPIKGQAHYWDKDIICYDNYEVHGGFCAMKTNGDAILNNSEYKTYFYSDGIFTASLLNSDAWVYLNESGEEILDILYE